MRRLRYKHRSVYFEVALLVEVGAHLVDYLGALHKGLAHLRVDNEVDIALSVAQLGVAEGVVHYAILLLDDRQGAEALAEHRETLHMDTGLTHLGDKDIACHADDVANVEQAFEDGVVEGLVLIGAYLVTLDVQLYAAVAVLQLHKRGGAHDAAAHDAACYADVLEEGVVLREFLQYFCAFGVHLIEGCGVGVDTQVLQLCQRIAAYLFLLSKFCHNMFACLLF